MQSKGISAKDEKYLNSKKDIRIFKFEKNPTIAACAKLIERAKEESDHIQCGTSIGKHWLEQDITAGIIVTKSEEVLLNHVQILFLKI